MVHHLRDQNKCYTVKFLVTVYKVYYLTKIACVLLKIFMCLLNPFCYQNSFPNESMHYGNTISICCKMACPWMLQLSLTLTLELFIYEFIVSSNLWPSCCYLYVFIHNFDSVDLVSRQKTGPEKALKITGMENDVRPNSVDTRR